MLCFRCEYRANFLENGRGPRYECGQIESSNGSCYMYKPCYPIVLGKDDVGDPRPWPATGILAARSRAIRLCDEAKLVAKKVKDGIIEVWEK